MSDANTDQIARFAAGLSFGDLDASTVHVATQHLIDALGCAIGARDCDTATIGRRVATGESAGRYAGRTLFADCVLPIEHAAFVNTALIRYFDFNDRYPGGHPSDCLGAHLALAGATPVDGARFLTAMVVSYEIFARLSDASQLSRNGWDQGYAIGIATAAGVCNLLGLTEAETANAIGIVATANLPLRNTRSGELTMWKNAATAFAVRNGLFAAMLAAEGMVGPGNAFEGRAGLFDNVTGPFELAPFPTEGGDFYTPRVLLKYFPIETNGLPVVWAALELREETDWRALSEIEVFAAAFTKYEIGSEPEKWDPQTRETADHSLPYIMARTLVDGPLTIASFTPEAVRDPALRPLMAKISVTVDDRYDAMLPEMGLRVAAKTEDGALHEIEVGNPVGHPSNPMQDSDIEEKFRTMAVPAIGAKRTDRALSALWQVQKADSLGRALSLLEL